MFFGQKLKELRVHKAEIGLRNFSALIQIEPSRLCNIEQGREDISSDTALIQLIIRQLNLHGLTSLTTKEEDELIELWNKPFIYHPLIMGVPSFICTIDGERPTKEQIEKLGKFIEENNKKEAEKLDKFMKENSLKLEKQEQEPPLEE